MSQTAVSELLYNGHRMVAAPAGFPNVVAVMCASMSEAQAELLLTRFGVSYAVILADGDAAGTRMAESALTHLAPTLWVRWEKLSENQQPTDLSASVLRERLSKVLGK